MKDNQPKHRQIAKARGKAERTKAVRRETGSALIVCEGECTEPFYLKGLIQHFGINSASVEIVPGESKSNAIAVVNRARERFEQDPRDRVFVVIDAEQIDLARAIKLCKSPLQRANRKKELPEIRIEPIITSPCFELWLLLHFRFTDQPFGSFEDVRPQLQLELPGYSKNDPHIFAKVGGGEGLQRALLHAEKLRSTLKATGAKSPDTNLDILVEAMLAIAHQD